MRWIVAAALLAACDGGRTPFQTRWIALLDNVGAAEIVVDSRGDVVRANSAAIAKHGGRDGVVQWSAAIVPQFQSSFDLAAMAVAPDDAILITGGGRGVVSFGDRVVSFGPDGATFVARLLPNGSIDWFHIEPRTVASKTNAIAVDDGGRVYVAGEYETSYAYSGCVFAFEPDGQRLWRTTIATRDISSLAIDRAGNLRVAGSFSSQVTFGSDTLNANALSRVFVASYDRDGRYLTTSLFGATHQFARAFEARLATADGLLVLQTIENNGAEPTVNTLRVLEGASSEPPLETIVPGPIERWLTAVPQMAVSAAWVDTQLGPQAPVGGYIELATVDAHGIPTIYRFGARLDGDGEGTNAFVRDAAANGNTLALAGGFLGTFDLGHGSEYYANAVVMVGDFDP